MSQEKYIGMDVHQATISVAVMDAQGKLIMECLLETKAATSVGLHDLLKPHVSRLVVCDPRKAALLKEGNKSDRIDATQLSDDHQERFDRWSLSAIEIVRHHLTRPRSVTKNPPIKCATSFAFPGAAMA